MSERYTGKPIPIMENDPREQIGQTPFLYAHVMAFQCVIQAKAIPDAVTKTLSELCVDKNFADELQSRIDGWNTSERKDLDTVNIARTDRELWRGFIIRSLHNSVQRYDLTQNELISRLENIRRDIWLHGLGL